MRWLEREAAVWKVQSGNLDKVSEPPQAPYFLYSGHLHPDKLFQLGLFDRRELQSITSFTFVRHPVARLKSLFLHFQRHSGFSGSLDDFISVAEGNALETDERLFQRIRQMSRPQSYWTTRRPGLAIEKTFKFEDFDTSLKELSLIFGLRFPPNSSGTSAVSRSTLELSQSQLLRIQDLYEVDLLNFSYELESY